MVRTPAPRPTPRISVNDLALYMVSSDTARMGIIKRSKYPSVPLMIRYKDVRPVVSAFLSDIRRPVNLLVEAEEMFNQRAEDPAESSLRKDDAQKCVEVLHSIQRMANQLASYQFSRAQTRQPSLDLGGVEISIQADLIVTAQIRSRPHQGAAVLRFTQADGDSETAIARRRDMGTYAATVVRLHAEQNLALEHPISDRLCMSIDVQYGEFFRTPDSHTRRVNDLENACRFIAAVWPSV